jgi:hypothetical protein
MKMILRIVSVLVGIVEMVLAAELLSGHPKFSSIYQLIPYAASTIPMFIVATWLVKFGFGVHWTKTEQKPLL